VIYHVANPLEVLTRLREMISEHLILSSAVVPTEIRNPAGALSFSPGQSLFVPHLDRATWDVIQRHFSDQEIRGAVGVTEPAVQWAVDDFAPWWWLVAGGCSHRQSSDRCSSRLGSRSSTMPPVGTGTLTSSSHAAPDSALANEGSSLACRPRVGEISHPLPWAKATSGLARRIRAAFPL